MNKNLTDKPLWVTKAYENLGLKEVKGVSHNAKILGWLAALGAWWRNDEVAWCGTFAAICLKQAGRAIPKHWYRALDYANYGTPLKRPAYGSIAVMERRLKGRLVGGHVTIIVGVSADGKYVYGIGGNQSDSVNVAKFEKSRILKYVWPETKNKSKVEPLEIRYDLPIINAGTLSTKED